MGLMRFLIDSETLSIDLDKFTIMVKISEAKEMIAHI